MANQQILIELLHIFHTHLLAMDLHLYKIEKKMMDMLRKESGKDWSTNLILNLAESNKIEWIRGLNDPLDPEKYQKVMNHRLAEILRTN